MSLRLKIILVIMGAFAVYAALDVAVLRLAILPEFEVIERREAIDDMERVESFLARELRQLSLFCHDWSVWDDSYAFVQDRNKEFIRSNMVDVTFLDNKINLIYYFDGEGKTVWGAAYLTPGMKPVRMSGFGPVGLGEGLLGRFRQGLAQGFSGLWLTEHGPMLLTFQTILTSTKKGPPMGMVAMGRLIGPEVLGALHDQTKVPTRFWALGDATTLDAEAAKALDTLRREGGKLVRRLPGGKTLVYGLLEGLDGRPALLVRTESSRGISQQGRTTVSYALASTLAAVLIMLALLMILLNKIVVSPLARLTAHMVDMGQSDDLGKRLDLRRHDELGLLAREFDRLVGRLAEARQSLMERSYISGQADMTAGVLHNVGNAMGPLVFGVNQGLEKLRSVPLANMDAARRELEAPDLDPERRAQLAEYLGLAEADAAAAIAETIADLQGVVAGIGRLEGILTEAMDVRCAQRPVETIRLDQLTREALSMIDPDLRRVFEISLDNSLEAVGPIRAHRMPLLQILGNLLGNAAEAIQRGGLGSGMVVVSAEPERVGQTDMVHLRVTDNGQGIAADQMERIFQRGFSTKAKASSGLGLHWSANAATSLGGRIRAHSNGLGKGSTFHLLIPVGPRS